MPRLGLPLAILAGALAAGVQAIAGWPDVTLVTSALTGQHPSGVAVAEVLVVLCWLAALLVTAVAALGVARGALRGRRAGRARAAAATALACLLLAAGVAHHLGGYRVCCAGPATDARAETLAR